MRCCKGVQDVPLAMGGRIVGDVLESRGRRPDRKSCGDMAGQHAEM